MSIHVQVAFDTDQGPDGKLLRSSRVLGLMLVRAKPIFRWTRYREANTM